MVAYQPTIQVNCIQLTILLLKNFVHFKFQAIGYFSNMEVADIEESISKERVFTLQIEDLLKQNAQTCVKLSENLQNTLLELRDTIQNLPKAKVNCFYLLLIASSFHFLQDVVSLLKDKVVHILHTKDGASVAMNCLWLSGAKVRFNKT